jgi:hypothetical protein
MSSTAGRVTRSTAGAALIVFGIVLGGGWLCLLAPGVLFLVVGVLDVCLLAPLFKLPLAGAKVRADA